MRSGFVNDPPGPGHLYFLVGLPHSGKSSFANAWVCKAETSVQHFYESDDGSISDTEVTITRPRVVISGDDFRLALHGQEYLPLAEATVFSMMDTAARALLMRGFDVLIDETSTSDFTLLRYLRIDPNATPIFLDTPVEECKRRALANGKAFLLRPIDRMAAQLKLWRASWKEHLERLCQQLEKRTPDDVAA